VLKYTVEVSAGLPDIVLMSGIGSPQHYNFHIFAERDPSPNNNSLSPMRPTVQQLKQQNQTDSDCKHVSYSWAALTALYEDLGGLKLNDEVAADVCNATPITEPAWLPVPSNLMKYETFSLEQRADLAHRGGGSHVATCAGLMLVGGSGA